jgi:hypothetical protein
MWVFVGHINLMVNLNKKYMKRTIDIKKKSFILKNTLKAQELYLFIFGSQFPSKNVFLFIYFLSVGLQKWNNPGPTQ